MAQTPEDRDTPKVAVLASLRHRDFRFLWAGAVLGSMSRWAMLVGQGWYIHDKTGSATLVGLATLAAFVPFLLGPLLGGPMADRYDRRKLAAMTFVVNFFFIAVLAALASVGRADVWLVIALAFLAGFVRSVENPSIQALAPTLVPRSDLLNAVVLMGMARHGARLAGPALAAVMLPTVGPSGAFASAAVASGLAALFTLGVGTTSRGSADASRHVIKNFMEALRFLYARPALALTMALIAAHCSLTMSYEAVLPVFAEKNLSGDSTTYSTLFMGVGVGAVAASLLMANLRTDRSKGRWLFVMGVASGLAPIGLGLTSLYSLALPLAFMVGASQTAFMSMTNAFILGAVPDSVRGRMSSLSMMHAGGMMGFASLANGQIADQFGATFAFVIMGVVYLVVLAFLVQLGAALRSVFMTGVMSIDTGQGIAGDAPRRQ